MARNSVGTARLAAPATPRPTAAPPARPRRLAAARPRRRRNRARSPVVAEADRPQPMPEADRHAARLQIGQRRLDQRAQGRRAPPAAGRPPAGKPASRASPPRRAPPSLLRLGVECREQERLDQPGVQRPVAGDGHRRPRSPAPASSRRSAEISAGRVPGTRRAAAKIHHGAGPSLSAAPARAIGEIGERKAASAGPISRSRAPMRRDRRASLDCPTAADGCRCRSSRRALHRNRTGSDRRHGGRFVEHDIGAAAASRPRRRARQGRRRRHGRVAVMAYQKMGP